MTGDHGAFPSLVEMGGGVAGVLHDKCYYPSTAVIDGPSATPRIRAEGSSSVLDNFASNTYLGLADHPRVCEAMKAAIDEYGTGAGAARLTAGTQSVHVKLEERIAAFKGREAAVLFSCGILANTGTIPALASSALRRLLEGTDGLAPQSGLFGSVAVFCAKQSHASVFDGCALGSFNLWGGMRARFYSYPHSQPDELSRLVSEHRRDQNMVVTDGVFSLHGHTAPLDRVAEVARCHGAVLYVDDAHGTWVLGPSGRGTAEMFGVDEQVDIPMGTFKALGLPGGFVVGTRRFCDYLRVAARTYMFQTAMTPSNAAGLIAAMEVAEAEGWRRQRLLENACFVRSELERIGFSTLSSKYHIIPVLVGDERVAIEWADELEKQGIFAPCYRYPAMPLGEAIIRCNMMATHTREQLERLVKVLGRLGKQYGIV